MSSFRNLRYIPVGIVLLGVAGPLPAQLATSPTVPPPAAYAPVITVSGDSVDRLRMAQLEGRAPLKGMLLRSTSSLSDPVLWGYGARGVTAILPQVTSAINSELPFGQNDGAMWAGKGYNLRVLGGLAVDIGPLRLVAIPELVSSTNYSNTVDVTDLRFSRPLPSHRSPFSSPFNVVPYSIDLPYRFGDKTISKIYPGQSSLTLSFGPMQLGGSTENEWWGPAQRNPLLLSDNAAGFPHAFLRTGRPLVSPVGVFDGRWIVGALKESDFFDNDESNDIRSLSAFALTWKQRPSAGFSIGLMRSVYAPADGYGSSFGKAFDFLRSTDRPNALPVTDSTMTPGPDQITSLFAHWALPRYGLETYVEWARTELTSLRQFILTPHHTRGYTGGAQWVKRTGENSRFRFQGELTNVEQSSTYRFGPIGSFYTSRAVKQGYTNEGQMLAAGIGPGSSGEWLAFDWFVGGLQAGANFSRTRFNNDAFFLKTNPHRCFHDVTVAPGLRGGWTNRLFRLRADYSKVTRYNTFWQRVRGCGSDDTAIGDRSSHSFVLTLSALGW